ncbi:MAG TPA: hypothetical protein VKA14_07265 [Gammaproteobacteria bacterium]|nr:hypothetical protein [Gammaproteobacteria bacterium]
MNTIRFATAAALAALMGAGALSPMNAMARDRDGHRGRVTIHHDYGRHARGPAPYVVHREHYRHWGHRDRDDRHWGHHGRWHHRPYYGHHRVYRYYGFTPYPGRYDGDRWDFVIRYHGTLD